jgi:methylated-DNA-[protein]-cysteine S-methyltransferase
MPPAVSTSAEDRRLSTTDPEVAPQVVYRYCLFETALGRCGVAWTDFGLSRVQLPERDAATTKRRLQRRQPTRKETQIPWDVARSIDLLQRYFAGNRTDFTDVTLDFSGIGSFNCQIYQELRRVGWGETTTYGKLAQIVNAPGSARAVGAAMSRNPWPVVVPCHRVLAAAKGIGGFSAFGGAATKRRLLQLEGIEVDDDLPLLRGLLSPQ